MHNAYVPIESFKYSDLYLMKIRRFFFTYAFNRHIFLTPCMKKYTFYILIYDLVLLIVKTVIFIDINILRHYNVHSFNFKARL